MSNLRILFMGSPAAVIPILQATQELGGTLLGVYTRPDQPAGRGRHIAPTEIKRYALEQGIPVYAPPTLRSEEVWQQLNKLRPELIVLAAYGRLVPPEILAIPRLGCVNVHPSLLPRHRGASPVAAAILAGDTVVGTTLLLMDKGLDTGPILAQRHESTRPSDRTPELTARLFAIGADLIREAIPAYVAGEVRPQDQSQEGITVTHRLMKENGKLEWTKPAMTLEREVRAHFAWPSSFTFVDGKQMQVLEASVTLDEGRGEPGTIVELPGIAGGVGVVTGKGVLGLHLLRLAGRPVIRARDLLRGNPGLLGSKLPS